jgi:hypothetical protein
MVMILLALSVFFFSLAHFESKNHIGILKKKVQNVFLFHWGGGKNGLRGKQGELSEELLIYGRIIYSCWN